MVTNTEKYLGHLRRVKAAQRERVKAAQDIGDLPKVFNKRRRAKAAASYEFFCSTYFPNAFTLPWADFHRQAAATNETACERGGHYAFAMPRGSGKTTMCEWATLWVILNGLCPYVVLIGSTEADAKKRLENLKTELLRNDLLLADYPEAIYPIRIMEGENRATLGQRYKGERTTMLWRQSSIVLPTIPGSVSSGSIIDVAGLTGSLRGKNHKRQDGSIVRPRLAIADDPQTRKSANSESDTDQRERIICGDVAYLAGPGQPIAVIMPCTVIYKGDLSDRMLDRAKHPEWQGERTKMVISFPKSERLWQEYAVLRADSFRNDGDGSTATEFYRKNRDAMDVGAVIAWPERYNRETELSAIQHVMNLKLRDEGAFMAEYQNEPITQQAEEITVILPEDIAAKTNGMKRSIVPHSHEKLTAFIDVHETVLYYVVASWKGDFSGAIVDYGTVPEQPRSDFALRGAKKTLALTFPGMALEGQLYSGLTALCDYIVGQDWERDVDRMPMRPERILIDANYSQMTELVYEFCRQCPYASTVTPSHGKGVRAGDKPWSQYKRRTGETLGNHWRLPVVKGTRSIRHVVFDTNWWKSFVHERWRSAKGEAGSLTLWGRKANGQMIARGQHLPFATQQCAEYPVTVQAKGQTAHEWRMKSHRPDNHYFDCVVGAAVAASMVGINLPGGQPVADAPRRRPRHITAESLRERFGR